MTQGMSPQKVSMSAASPWKSPLCITELAFLPAFRQLQLVCSILKNGPMVISYAHPHSLAKSPKIETTRLPLLWLVDPACPCQAGSRPRKSPGVSTSHLSPIHPGAEVVSLLKPSLHGLGQETQHYRVPKPLNDSQAGSRPPLQHL